MSNVKDLDHVTRLLPNGGKVVVLNTGAIISPEAQAMLQALHSRSTGGIDAHLKVLAERGSDNFMSAYYVGYGHKSIGDCGTTTIFIEGVSMLAAKAIQDWPLYSGQESSTRYLDFSTQPFVDPLGTKQSITILEQQRSLYLRVLDELVPVLIKRHPRKEDEKESIYEKAIKARAFDITRSLLPSGAATNLAWHSNLRQVADKLMLLRVHPLAEVREIADAIEDAVQQAYPNSFGHKRYPETERYNRDWMQTDYYYTRGQMPEFAITFNGIDQKLLKEYRPWLEHHLPKTELPKQIAECGTLRFEFLLDFGSFRDIQRQRAVTQRMPLVTTDHGFELWYLKQMSKKLREEIVALLEIQCEAVQKLGVAREVRQYYIPMGYRLPNRLVGNLHALVYLIELRASSAVHPTLQIIAHKMATCLRDLLDDYGIVIYTDDNPGRFDIKRGKHDITKIS